MGVGKIKVRSTGMVTVGPGDKEIGIGIYAVGGGQPIFGGPGLADVAALRSRRCEPGPT